MTGLVTCGSFVPPIYMQQALPIIEKPHARHKLDDVDPNRENVN